MPEKCLFVGGKLNFSFVEMDVFPPTVCFEEQQYWRVKTYFEHEERYWENTSCTLYVLKGTPLSDIDLTSAIRKAVWRQLGRID